MNEFEFIAKHLSGIAGSEAINLKDDVALWIPPSGKYVVLSTDTMVEGVHFPQSKFDADIARKLISVNVSDLVAKGADPIGYVLNLTVSRNTDQGKLVEFCNGLAQQQKQYDLSLWGGDTTRTDGPNVVSITILGTVPTGEAVLRSGARPGDVLCVTGTIGDAYLGLKKRQDQLSGQFNEDDRLRWSRAYNLPSPPYVLRQSIRKYAKAALDISDGLVADAAHLAEASHVGLDIRLDNIPLSSPSQDWLNQQSSQIDALIELATGGDDYQVLMSVAPQDLGVLRKEANSLEINLSEIGNVTEGMGVRCLDFDGNVIPIEKPGYTHF